jgi:hypothetical protein
MEADNLVFLDESHVNIGMTRLYGRAAGEERVIDYVPDVRMDRVSILSSVRLNGEIVPVTYEGNLDGVIFHTYITECLVPTLEGGRYCYHGQFIYTQGKRNCRSNRGKRGFCAVSSNI